MVLGGQLERASSVADGPRFAIKGAVGLEMRLRTKARATRDIDLVVDEGGGPWSCAHRAHVLRAPCGGSTLLVPPEAAAFRPVIIADLEVISGARQSLA
jgi:hypothetical protein